MTTYVAFLRAISVGGHASVRMTDLKDAFARAGCRDVQTYIQSGNVVFQAPENRTTALLQRIQLVLRKLLGAEPGLVFRTAREIETIIKRAPFKRLATEHHIKLYVTFLAAKPQRKARFPLRSPKEALEAVALKGLEVFVHGHQDRGVGA